MDQEDRDHFKTIANLQVGPLAGLPKLQGAGSSSSIPDLAFCLERTKVLLSCYRRDESHDPELYSAAIAAILSDYPKAVVQKVTDPRTGIAGKIKFLPSAAEVMEACNDAAQTMARLADTSHRKVLPRQETPIKPGQVNYAQFLANCEKDGKKPRPIGRFESGPLL